jgi:hypothetical protein
MLWFVAGTNLTHTFFICMSHDWCESGCGFVTTIRDLLVAGHNN